MDLNDIRSATTVFSFVVFLGIIAWAWAGERRASFAAAAQLPFVDSVPAGVSQGEQE